MKSTLVDTQNNIDHKQNIKKKHTNRLETDYTTVKGLLLKQKENKAFVII